jgi:hypothetical protein
VCAPWIAIHSLSLPFSALRFSILSLFSGRGAVDISGHHILSRNFYHSRGLRLPPSNGFHHNPPLIWTTLKTHPGIPSITELGSRCASRTAMPNPRAYQTSPSVRRARPWPCLLIILITIIKLLVRRTYPTLRLWHHKHLLRGSRQGTSRGGRGQGDRAGAGEGRIRSMDMTSFGNIGTGRTRKRRRRDRNGLQSSKIPFLMVRR